MSRRGWLLFAAMGAIWGVPYLLIKVAVRDLEPGTLVFARTAPATLLLLPLALRRVHWARLLAHARWVLAYTVIEVALPWLLLSRAEQRLSSSLSGLLVASVPLVGAVLVLVLGGDERLCLRRILGLLVGISGVALLLGIDVRRGDLGAVAEIGLVAVLYATGPLIVSRRLSDLSSLEVVSASLVLTAVGYAPYAVTHWPRHVSGEVASSVAVLSVVCTAMAFLLFFALIAEVGPTRATVITYVNPAVAVVLGVAVLGEPFTLGIGVGLPVVLLGSYLATVSTRARQAAAAPALDDRVEADRFPGDVRVVSGTGDARTRLYGRGGPGRS
jgi:drug/metabolite transporter (DMT)-like permease